MHELLMTAVGADRPGLVDEITGFLLSHGGNITDSRMANLRGRFAIILLVNVPDLRTAQIIADDASTIEASTGLHVDINVDSRSEAEIRGGLTFRLRTYAMDQPGIVHRITHLLSSHGVNIEEMQTRLDAKSYSGTPQFSMEMTMTLPGSLSIKTLRAEVEALCDSLNCDVELEPASSKH